MNHYESSSVVSKMEAEALKDMIFNRVKERSKALADDVNQSYMSSVQNEVMDIARNSFVANKNPFSMVAQDVKTEPVKEEMQEEVISSKQKFIQKSKKQAEELKRQIYNNQNEYQKDYANTFVRESMLESRSLNGVKTNFIGALNFLNAQASIALVNSSGKHFDATA